MLVYHHTSLAHLPYILADAELVSASARGDWPSDFVWATTNPNGDRTVAACRQKAIPRVRMAFDVADFEPWETAVDAHQDWNADHKGRLLDAARDLGQPNTDCWFVAASALPVAACRNIEVKTWASRWRTEKPILEAVHFAGDGAQFICLGSGYAVARHRGGDGCLHYVFDAKQEPTPC